MTETDHPAPDPAGAPAVGNILGFSLLFRDKKALLSLEARSLTRGIRLTGYEAEIPGVSFPLKAPMSVLSFRHKRCVALRMGLRADTGALQRWLEERLVGREYDGFHVRRVEIDFEGRPLRELGPVPCLHVEGGTEDGSFAWLTVAFRIVPRGRRLRAEPLRTWLFGAMDQDGAALWRRLSQRLEPYARDDGALEIDPAGRALTRPLAKAGWKAPSCADLELRSIAVGPRRIELEFDDTRSAVPDPLPARAPKPGPDPVTEHIARTAEALQAGDRRRAVGMLERLSAMVTQDRATHMATLRWRVRVTRFTDPVACLRAVRAWLDVRPGDAEARMLLVALLARAGEANELARLIAGACRMPHPPAVLARLELALATLLVDRLRDPTDAAALLEPLVDRIRAEPSLDGLFAPALAVLARARAAGAAPTVEAAMAPLEEALGLSPDPWQRAAMRIGVARAFSGRGARKQALHQLRLACEETPDDPTLLDRAIDLAAEIGDLQGAVDLLHARIAAAPAKEARTFRRKLIDLLSLVDDAKHGALALAQIRLALDDEPNDADLLRQAAELEQRFGDPDEAATHLQRLTDNTNSEEEKARLRTERARLLRGQGRNADAWSALEPALDLPDGAAARERLELALELCPPESRDAILDRLIALGGSIRAGEALLERANRPDRDSRAREDLLAAANLMGDPRVALRALTRRANATVDDWTRLADACDRLEDLEGEGEARTQAGLLALGDGDPERAVVALRRAVEVGEEGPAPRFALATAHHQLGDTEDALACLKPLLNADAAVVTAALKAAEVERAELPSHHGAVLLLASQLLVELKRPEEAAEILERVRQAAPRGSAEHDQSARLLVDLNEQLERPADARRASLYMADMLEGPERAHWLVRTAELSAPAERVALLREADSLDPDAPEIQLALERTLESLGEHDSLEEMLDVRLRSATVERDVISIIERLVRLKLRRLDARPTDANLAQELDGLYERWLDASAYEEELCLTVASFRWERGDKAGAAPLLERALIAMADEDPRSVVPCLRLGRWVYEDGHPRRAVQLAERIMVIDPTHGDGLRLLLDAGDEAGLADAVRTACEGLAPLARNPVERANLNLKWARADDRLGDPGAAFEHLKEAAAAAEPATPLHLEIAETWLELATRDDGPPDAARRRQESAARAQMRIAMGSDVSARDVRLEAVALAELDRSEEAMALLEKELDRRDGEELLLSTLKEIATTAGDLVPYVRALEQAVAQTSDEDTRDRLASELAFMALEVDEPDLTLRALDSLTRDRASDDEMLDARDWAIRRLGRERGEIQAVERDIREGLIDANSLGRLERVLGDDQACLEALFELGNEVDDAHRGELAQASLKIALRLEDREAALQSYREVSRYGDAATLGEVWSVLERLTLESGDDNALIELLAAADEGELDGSETATSRFLELMESALVEHPESEPLAAALWQRLSREFDDPQACLEACREFLERVASRGPDLIALHELVADHAERAQGSQLLELAAAAHVQDAEIFSRLVDALQMRNHWPEVMRLLERHAEATEDDDARIETLKRLAHICTDVLDDVETATEHLERALEIRPDDADLLLSTLDLHYAQADLPRAIELTGKALDVVTMGDAAYVALADRAVDAALARNDFEVARTFLEGALERMPSSLRTKARIDEIDAMVRDPVHRVKLLASIADRQTGNARIEALEERARLLLDPLDRVDDAITDLELVVLEAPDREASEELLLELYQQTERWPELVKALEHRAMRLHDIERCLALRRVALIRSRHLYDLAAAEEALRMALDALGEPAIDEVLGDKVRLELARCLESQGSFSDLAALLDGELEAELTADPPLAEIRPARLTLMAMLAQIRKTRLDDEPGAGLVYERMDRAGRLPEEGLAALVKTYRAERRYDDMVRILSIRATALEEAGDRMRKADLDQRIAEILEGPLARPHDAARHYVDAYLADPLTHAESGARARVLLSGTDSLANVRTRLLARAEEVLPEHRPTLLTLLADVLAPHDETERDAEASYRKALELRPDFAGALEGLGRLLSRQGRYEDCVKPLVEASEHPDLPSERAADDAAIAARALVELGRDDEAEDVLRSALVRAPDNQRALMELARLYQRLERAVEETETLDDLSKLPLPGILRAEVGYRRAMLLEQDFANDARSGQADRARDYLLEALGADSTHTPSRQALTNLATRREEWSLVAQMQNMAVRDVPPGPQRAIAQLDLAETYLNRLRDQEAALPTIEGAIQQAPRDIVVVNRASGLLATVPDAEALEARLLQVLDEEQLEPAARAFFSMHVAGLRLRFDDPTAAEERLQEVLTLPGLPEEVASQAQGKLEELKLRSERDLAGRRTELMRRLEQAIEPAERLQVLARLREIGRALDDTPLVEQVSREQLALAHQLASSDEHRELAISAVRELYAERANHRKIVELYEELAARTADATRAADMLADAARFAWHGLRSTQLAAALARQSLGRDPDHDGALGLVHEIGRVCEDSEVAATLLPELNQIQPLERSAPLSIQMAELAQRIGRHEEAIGSLRVLVSRDLRAPLMYQALTRLDALLARAADPSERIPVLEQLLALAPEEDPARGPALALALAELQRSLGQAEMAGKTCAQALRESPDHRGLCRLYAELLEQAENWEALGAVMTHLADLAADGRERANWLSRAAQIHLDHPESVGGTPAAVAAARKLLGRARQASRKSTSARATLLPLSFQESQFKEVLELAAELRAISGDAHPALVLAALTESFVNGRRDLANAIGSRHERGDRERYLWPGMVRLLGEVAREGPLPRLDPILGAGATLTGDPEQLVEELKAFATGHALEPGLALGLARLYEARGRADAARNLYQLGGFMEPGGPLPALCSRLPAPRIPDRPLEDPAWSSLEARGPIRSVLLLLRPKLGGITTAGWVPDTPTAPSEQQIVATANRVVAPFRGPLGLSLPVAFSRQPISNTIGVKNTPDPTLVVSTTNLDMAPAELQFQMAFAAATIASGLAVVADPQPVGLGDLVDALAVVSNPAYVANTRTAMAIADALSARGVQPSAFGPEVRAALDSALSHMGSNPEALGRLEAIQRRNNLLVATRLSGHLDGALMSLARDHGTSSIEDTLALEETRWLLRAVGLF